MRQDNSELVAPIGIIAYHFFEVVQARKFNIREVIGIVHVAHFVNVLETQLNGGFMFEGLHELKIAILSD